MRILKLLNKKNFSIILFFLSLGLYAFAEENPVDIWNNEEKSFEEKTNNSELINNEIIKKKPEVSIYEMQSIKENEIIELNSNNNEKLIKIIGLYDPEENGLDINMWNYSDGDQLKNIFRKLNKIDLSSDAAEIMNTLLLTNAYNPKRNITKKEFIKIKTNWLIKNSNLDLIEEYLIKNQIIDIYPELTKYLVDQHLSNSNINKACEVFKNNSEPIENQYLVKFNIYCLINSGMNDKAQLIFDLKKELGFKDEYFEKKVNYLFGYSSKPDLSISEKSILDFHLAHKINSGFTFEPKDSTSKIIWKYLSSSNLLNSFQETKISEIDKISTIERAVHNKNYPEQDLFEIYKRFQFNINQLLEAKKSYKSLSGIEARALIYQKILLESEMIEKLKLLKILKKSFEDEDLSGAFDVELKKFLNEMDPIDIPANLTSFYYTNIQIKNKKQKKIKFDNEVMHQSKLINYFNDNYPEPKIQKDVNNFLKKIKKKKKYFLSKRDIIFLESLKSDGIKFEKKYDNLYEVNETEIPTDIKIMINNNEKAAALLRIVEVIGEDDLERIDDDTLYFIISTLNQLNIRKIRNKILLKVLPLKV